MQSFKRPVLLAFLLLTGVAIGQTTRTPVLVELFTSEGCSSCPPADRLLATLSARQPVAGAEVIALEEHVDYWEGQGWHDRFSSPAFTKRQNLYRPHLGFDSPYTPQMVVDGDVQFVGNDPSKAFTAITKAATKSKFSIELAPPEIAGKRMTSRVSSNASASSLHGDLYAALVEPAASTEVRSGENKGRRLEHVSVVRVLQRVGNAKELAKGPLTIELVAPMDTDSQKLRLVVFVQQENQGGVRAIAVSSPAS